MRKISIYLIAFVSTFGLSLGLAAWLILRGPHPIVGPPVTLGAECTPSLTFPGLSQNIANLEKSGSGYFPKNTWLGYRNRDEFVSKWYAGHLATFREESLLSLDDPDAEIYRFLWLRSFNPPVVITVRSNGKSGMLSTKELNGNGSYNSGKIVRSASFQLSESQWCELLSSLENAGFWRIASWKTIRYGWCPMALGRGKA